MNDLILQTYKARYEAVKDTYLLACKAYIAGQVAAMPRLEDFEEN